MANMIVPLVLEPQPEGGYTVTSPLLPELVTEGDTVEECLVNAEDALQAVIETYEDHGWRLPEGLRAAKAGSALRIDALLAVS